MDYSWVENILREWNFGDYVNAFIEQEINQEAFKCLDDESIKSLFPKAGPRAIFKKKLSAFQRLDNHNLPTDIDDNFQLFAVESVSSENNESEVRIEDMEVEIVDPFKEIDNADISLKLCNPIVDLLECLRESVLGVCVLSFYKKNHMLDNYYRNLLCDVILHVELRAHTALVIVPDRLHDLSKLIIEVFPTEDIQTYYIPYCQDQITKNKASAKGKLHQKYHHLRGILLQAGVAVPSRGVKRKKIDKSLVYLGFYDNLHCEETSDEISQQLDFLHDNIDPWPTIELYWRNSSVMRIKKLVEDKTTTSSEYIDSFPILQHAQKALLLINIDFTIQYPTKTDQLNNEIDSFKSEILRLCKAKKKPNRKVKELLLNLEKTNNTKDTEDILIFRLLPLLLPCPPAIYKSGKEPHRAEKEEVQEEFLHHVKNEEEFKASLKKRTERFTSYGITEQPLSVIVGETLESIHSYYLVINNRKYEAQSIREVIDLNFKSCYSFQLAFSRIALFPWLVLQERIYKIKGEADEVRPCISAFLTSLKTSV